MIPLPPLAAKGTPWAHEAGDIHDILVYVLLGFIVLHVLGALYHYFIKRDRVVQRMLMANDPSPRYPRRRIGTAQAAAPPVPDA